MKPPPTSITLAEPSADTSTTLTDDFFADELAAWQSEDSVETSNANQPITPLIDGIVERAAENTDTPSVAIQQPTGSTPNAKDREAWDVIKKMWQTHESSDEKAVRLGSEVLELGLLAKKTRVQANALKLKLGEALRPIKLAKVGKGRDGKWGQCLDYIGMHRNTADRYIEAYEERENLERSRKIARRERNNLTFEELRKIEEKKLDRFVAKVSENIVQRVKTVQAAIELLDRLRAHLERGVNREASLANPVSIAEHELPGPATPLIRGGSLGDPTAAMRGPHEERRHLFKMVANVLHNPSI